MSQTRYGRKKKLMSEINVVPYIDVMLVLLIIFMVTAPLLNTGVKVELPKATAQPMTEQNQEPFIVTVDADGNYYINDNETKISSVQEIKLTAAAVLKENPKLPFLVRGDGATKYAHVVQAMVWLQHAGVDTVGLITEPHDAQ